jgi:hypothetical protein
LLRILQEVLEDRYHHDDHFAAGGPPKPTVVARPPDLVPDKEYVLFGLNALTTRGEFVSLPAGGLAFEDPAWALLTANTAARNARPRLAVPRARDADDLWRRLTKVDAAITGGAFKPEDFFGPILGWIPPATQPRFELLTVSGDQAHALRTRGNQALKVSRPPKYFELYEPDSGSKSVPRG